MRRRDRSQPPRTPARCGHARVIGNPRRPTCTTPCTMSSTSVESWPRGATAEDAVGTSSAVFGITPTPSNLPVAGGVDAGYARDGHVLDPAVLPHPLDREIDPHAGVGAAVEGSVVEGLHQGVEAAGHRPTSAVRRRPSPSLGSGRRRPGRRGDCAPSPGVRLLYTTFRGLKRHFGPPGRNAVA